MNTKTLLICTAAVAASLGMASCDSKDPTLTESHSFSVANLFTPLEGDAANSFVSRSEYKFTYDIIAGKVTIVTPNLVWDQTVGSIEFGPAAYRIANMQDGGQIISIPTASGHASDKSVSVGTLSGTVTNRMYYTDVKTPGITDPKPAYLDQPLVMLDYTLGDAYRVRTFNTEAYAGGCTETSFEYAGQPTSYVNDDMIYRWIINTVTMKANVVIYNARFAAQQPQPLKGIIIKGLDVKWTESGYSITGSDIVPEVIEGTSTTPNSNYIFDSFQLNTTGEHLSTFEASYTVGGRYRGQFTGSLTCPLPEGTGK